MASLWLAAMVHGVRAEAPAGIGIQPVSRTVLEGCPATFDVGVTGTPPISLEWLRDDLPLPGETNASFTLRAVTLADSGARFRAKASNAFGSDLSAEALLTVIADERGNPIAPGSEATFRARAPRAQALLFEAFRRPSCGVVACLFFEWTTNLQDELFLSAYDTRTVYPDDSHDFYTVRVSGYFVPPVSGHWIFYLRSDDDSRLYLGTNGLDPNGVRLIAQEPGCCRPFSANPSPPVALRANQPYYIEGLYREHIGGDYLQVAAKLETDPTAPDALPPIPSEYLMPFLDSASGLISIQSQPRDATVLLNASATFTVTATSASLNPVFPFPFLHYQWQRLASEPANWVDLPGATSASYTTPPRPNCDSERYRCRLYAPGSTTLTAEALLATVAPRIDVRRTDNSLVIEWTLGGGLQSAPTVGGPWTEEPFGSNPWTVPLPASPRFYRAVFGR